MLLTTLWPGGITLWRWVHDFVPGAGGLRAVGRVGMLLLFPAAIGVAYFFERRVKHRKVGLVAMLGLAMAIEQGSHIPRYDKSTVRQRIEAIASGVDTDCRAFFLSTVDPRTRRLLQEDAMWVALETGVPAINGRYGSDPPGWRLRSDGQFDGDPTDRRQVEAALAAWLHHNCLEAAEICWLESGGGALRRPRISTWTPCSAP